MLRAVEDCSATADLDRIAEVDHHHLVGDMAHDGKIVRDEHIGKRKFLLQAGEQVERLGADRNIQRRHGLVEHQDLRLQHERAGNGDALALAAREHVRVAMIIFGP